MSVLEVIGIVVGVIVLGAVALAIIGAVLAVISDAWSH
jgi:hypothetical protein